MKWQIGWLNEPVTKEVAAKAKALGFNAIVVRSSNELAAANECAIAPVGENFFSSEITLCLHEANMAKDVELLPRDLALLQAKEMEKKVKELLFFLPAETAWHARRQSEWMENFLDDLKITTALAFSAFSGPPDAFHLPLNPFWQKIEKWVGQGRRAIPIIDLSGPQQGLWPQFLTPLYDRILPRLRKVGIIGYIAKMEKLQDSLFFQKNISCFNQAFLHRKMAEEELSLYYLPKERAFGEECYHIAVKAHEMATLPEAGAVPFGQALLARLKSLQFSVPTPFLSSFAQFEKDIKKIILKT
jgi:hypothetical protein